MGLEDLRIVFDNPWSTYYPGQTVTGRVIVRLSSIKKIRGISLKIKGEANTCWATDRQELNNEGRYENESQTVTGHEEYFSQQYYLVGSASGDEMELPVGEHVYPFTCSLPPSLPSSFESHYGHVRYTVKAILDRPWKFDQEVKTAFTVVSNFDLNREPRASEPINQEASKTFCCLCCGSEPLKVNVTLPARGYVPGQAMPIRVTVDNKSGVVVETVKLILRKIVTFRATTPRSDTKRDKIVVAEVSKGPVPAGDYSDYEQRLEVPPLPPSNLANCSIIDLEYNLKIEACVVGWYHCNLKNNTLVFIGTVPLANYQRAISPPAMKGPAANEEKLGGEPADPTYGGYPKGYPAYAPGGEPGATLPLGIGGYPSIPPTAPEIPEWDNNGQPNAQSNSHLYPNLPPPSYEESGWSIRSLREPGESDKILGLRSHFAPRYPVYNFAPPSQ
ncbi:arrestin domain-containing protein 17-like [Venturia canescens]|uniref:arrestin domain-containing protein 17-like n=1 Tax=Venturia canescens TaxID=32260 RepID=UPI001C9C8A68|nr:arrestin domain-containing protein 17-like [Venturia canescens]